MSNVCQGGSIMSEYRNWKEIPVWRDVTEEEWNDWKWQIKNRITDVDQLRKVIKISDEEAVAIDKSLAKLRMAITPYYASLMDPDNPSWPVRMQAVPSTSETRIAGSDIHD